MLNFVAGDITALDLGGTSAATELEHFEGTLHITDNGNVLLAVEDFPVAEFAYRLGSWSLHMSRPFIYTEDGHCPQFTVRILQLGPGDWQLSVVWGEDVRLGAVHRTRDIKDASARFISQLQNVPVLDGVRLTRSGCAPLWHRLIFGRFRKS